MEGIFTVMVTRESEGLERAKNKYIVYVFDDTKPTFYNFHGPSLPEVSEYPKANLSRGYCTVNIAKKESNQTTTSVKSTQALFYYKLTKSPTCNAPLQYHK